MRSNTRVLRSAAVVLILAGSALAADAQERTGGLGHAVPQGTTLSSPFLGGVPYGEATAAPVRLSLREAVDQGLAHNLGVLLQEQGLESARGSLTRIGAADARALERGDALAERAVCPWELCSIAVRCAAASLAVPTGELKKQVVLTR